MYLYCVTAAPNRDINISLDEQQQKKANLRLTSAKEMMAQYKSQSRENHDGGAHGPQIPPPPCVQGESSFSKNHPF